MGPRCKYPDCRCPLWGGVELVCWESGKGSKPRPDDWLNDMFAMIRFRLFKWREALTTPTHRQRMKQSSGTSQG
jgi:hypothetical protein